MKKKYQVFVSSTYEDLKDERKIVTQALLEANCIPAGMELFPASSLEQWEIIKKVIDDCDYYLVMIAGRYGSINKAERKRSGKIISYTEMEYNYAKETGKPIIAFIHRNPDKLSAEKCETTRVGRDRLKKFRNEASTGRTVRYWSNKDELKSDIILSMQNLIRDVPTQGWVKSDSVTNPADIPTSSSDFYTGQWKSTTYMNNGTEIDKEDILNLYYDGYTGMIRGIIDRITPEDQNQRKWNCIGCVVGESIVIMYYSQQMRSVGCGLVRHYHNLLYKGSYLRYNYGTRKIECIKLTMQKVEDNE